MSRARARARARAIGGLALALALAVRARASASGDVGRVVRSARKFGPTVDARGALDDAQTRAIEVAMDVVDPLARERASVKADGRTEDEEASDDARDAEDEDEDEEPSFRSDEDDGETGDVIGTYDTCDVCERCALGDAPAGTTLNARARSGAATTCSACYGCNLVIERLPSKTTFMNKSVALQRGASGAAVFAGRTRARSESEAASDSVKDVFVKAWCGLRGDYQHHLDDPNGRPQGYNCTFDRQLKSHPSFSTGPHCREKATDGSMFCNHAFLGALDTIAREAGLADVIPRAYSLRALTYTPWDGTSSAGVKQDVDVMVFDKAPGASYESLSHMLTPENLELLRKISPEKILKLALFDVLTTQADRHGQNVFVTEDGDIHGIDNEAAMNNELNSMFIPGGQKFEVYRLGYHVVCCAVTNICGQREPSHPSLGTLLDYRCYVDGGYIGKNFPTEFEAFLKRVDAMKDAEEVYEYFKMAVPSHAVKFKERVHDLLTLGFEGTVKKVYSQMYPGDGRYGNFEYAIQPRCCGPGDCTMNMRLPDSAKSSCIRACDAPMDPRAQYFIGANDEKAWRAFETLDSPPASNESAVDPVAAPDPEPASESVPKNDTEPIEPTVVPADARASPFSLNATLEDLRARLLARVAALRDLRRVEREVDAASSSDPPSV